MKILRMAVSVSLPLASFCFLFAFLLEFILFCTPHYDAWGSDENCLTQHSYVGWAIVAGVIGLVAVIMRRLKE